MPHVSAEVRVGALASFAEASSEIGKPESDIVGRTQAVGLSFNMPTRGL